MLCELFLYVRRNCSHMWFYYVRKGCLCEEGVLMRGREFISICIVWYVFFFWWGYDNSLAVDKYDFYSKNCTIHAMHWWNHDRHMVHGVELQTVESGIQNWFYFTIAVLRKQLICHYQPLKILKHFRLKWNIRCYINRCFVTISYISKIRTPKYMA